MLCPTAAAVCASTTHHRLLCDPLLQVVRLAVEAQALSALLLLLAQAQQVAADSQDPSAALKWPDFEAMMGVALRALQGQLHSLPGHGPRATSAAASAEQPAAGSAAAGTAGVAGAAAGVAVVAAAEEEAEEAPPLPAEHAQMAEAAVAGAAGTAGSRPGTAGSSGEEEEEEGELLAEPPLPAEPLASRPAEAQARAAAIPAALAGPAGPPLPEAALSGALFPAAAAAPAQAVEQYGYPLAAGGAPLPAAELAPVPLPAEASGAAATEQQRKKRKPVGMGELVSKKARGGAVAAAAGPAGSHAKLGKGTASLINKWQKVAQQVRQAAMQVNGNKVVIILAGWGCPSCTTDAAIAAATFVRKRAAYLLPHQC